MTVTSRILRPFALLLAGLFVVLAFSAAAVPSASADVGGGAHTAQNSGLSQQYGVCASNETVDSSVLPVTRWAGGTDKFHSRLGTKAWNDVAEKLQRQGVITVMYAVGNTAWTTATGLIETAINFCVLDKAGGAVDRTSARLGNALLNSGIVAAFVVASLLLYVWRVGRAAGGGQNTSMIFQKALIVGLFGIMVTGATVSSGGGAGGSDAAYVPGPGSPGWFATTIDNVVSASANSVTSSVQGEITGGAETGWGNKDYKGNDNLGCAVYVGAMKEVYKERYAEQVGGKSYYTAASSVPLMLSSMWENTGLRMWIQAQFGTQNDYGQYMYCRLLEYNADAPRNKEDTDSGASIEELMVRAGSTSFANGNNGRKNIDVNPDNLAFRYSGSNTWRDRAWVGWAACSYPAPVGETDGGTNLIHKDGGVSDTTLGEVCDSFFNEADWNGKDDGEWCGCDDGDALDWDDSNDDVSQTDTTNAAKDFVLSLHGNKNGAGLVTGLVYMFSSILIAVVFGMFAIAILVAKIAALMMMLLMVFTLLVALLPSMTASKIVDYAKQYVGLSLFAWGAQLVLAILSLITSILVDVGGDVVPGGPGGIMGLMWTGFAPVIAAICLHIMFKKMRVPSPLKVSSGMAWGQMAASGALGAAAGGGAGALASRLGNRVKRGSADYAKGAFNNVTGRDRPGQMKPGGKPDPRVNPDTNGDGVVDAAERAAVGRANREDLKAARGLKGDEAAAYKEQMKQVEAERKRGVRAHVATRVENARQQFREKPLKTTAKAALIAGGALTATALVPGAAVAAAVGVGALAGRSGMAKTARTINPLDRARSQDDRIEAYRRHQANQRSQEQAVRDQERADAKRSAAEHRAAVKDERDRRTDAYAKDLWRQYNHRTQSNGDTYTTGSGRGPGRPAPAPQPAHQ